jgi:hypothetical protein
VTNVTREVDVCLNCSAPLHGSFCSQCGQRAVPAYPTVRELAGDAIGELWGWDGRFVNTIRTLFRHPGKLTKEWLEGRRASFVSPLRLYLSASLLYFIAAAASPNLDRSSGAVVDVAGARIGIFTPRAPGPGEETSGRGRPLTDEEMRAALASIDSAPPIIRPILRRAMQDPQAVQRGILTAMPRALFALLPVFAGILALFYRRLHYPEHLYFAVHLHAFVFLALAFSELSKLTGIFALAGVVGVGMLAWIVVYAMLSLRRVYGGSIGGTLVKAAGIGLLYAIVSTPVLIALIAWAAMRA